MDSLIDQTISVFADGLTIMSVLCAVLLAATLVWSRLTKSIAAVSIALIAMFYTYSLWKAQALPLRTSDEFLTFGAIALLYAFIVYAVYELLSQRAGFLRMRLKASGVKPKRR